MRMTQMLWKDDPDDHDYPAAASYLSLLASAETVATLVEALTSPPLRRFHAKDIQRAAGLSLLPVDNPHVAADVGKVEKGHRLSPVPLVRGELSEGVACRSPTGTTGCAPAITWTRTQTSPSDDASACRASSR
jgi:hypothetical protein